MVADRFSVDRCAGLLARFVVLLFSRVASGQITLRRIDGWRKIAAMLGSRAAVAV